MQPIDRIAFVTGASRGIGRGAAQRLLSEGYRVACGYHVNEQMTQDAFSAAANALPVEIDVSDRKSVRAAIDETTKHFGAAPQILVNNAAIAQEKPFEQITDADWDQMMAVNLRGPFVCSQEVLPAMLEKKWGRIINITSIGGQWGGFNQAHYAAAKAGLINLTRSLAKLYSGVGVCSNAIAIGLVATNMSAKELSTEAGMEKVKAIPAGRLGAPDDVAGVVAFLCSDDASYLTGQTINVNGGMYFG